MTRKLGPLFDAQANMEAWIEAGEEIDWQWAEEEALKASHALRGTPDLLSFWRDAIRKEYEAFEAASAGWPGGSTISVRALPSGDPDEDRKRHSQSELDVAAILARRLTMLIFSALNGDEKIQALKESVPLLRKHLDRLSAIARDRAPKA